jgi:hypothetical protein
MAGVTPGLRNLLGRLQAYAVDWKFSFVPTENEEYEPGIDREVADLSSANVVSSTLLNSHTVINFDPKKPFSEQEKVPRHAVLLDIDYPAHLVESSTPGHFHLYLDVPAGVEHGAYMNLLGVLRDCGIIEKGYADVSIARGHSDLRLPWVTKDDQVLHAAQPGVDLVPLEPAVPVENLGGLF